MRRRVIALLGVALLAGGVYITRRGAAAPELAPSQPHAPDRWSAPGILEGDPRPVSLHFKRQGVVSALLVEVGAEVTRGTVLARVESSQESLAEAAALARVARARALLGLLLAGARKEEVEVAKAELDLLRSDAHLREGEHARSARLYLAGALPQAEVQVAQTVSTGADARARAAAARLSLLRNGARVEERQQAAAEVALAEAELEMARVALKETELVARSDGIVLKRHIEIGERVGTGERNGAFVLGTPRPRRVRVELDQAQLSRARLGQVVQVRDEFGSAKPLPGRVVRIDPVVGERRLDSEEPLLRLQTKVVAVYVDLDDVAPWPIGLRVDVYGQ